MWAIFAFVGKQAVTDIHVAGMLRELIMQERSTVAADPLRTAETAVLEQKDRKLPTLCIRTI